MLWNLEHFTEESFGGPRVSFCAKHKVNRLAGGIRLNPPVNGRVIEREATLPHHFLQVTIAESITQIPTNAEKDDFALVMTPFELIGFGHSGPLV
jgi:hypothetical protein